MNLHPYLTPDLLTLIRTAPEKDIYKRLQYVHAEADTDLERKRLGFQVEAQTAGGRSMGINLPIIWKGFSFSGGYRSLKRRVDCWTSNWRELFITRFNEVLHDCESRLAASKAQHNANVQREQIVKARKSAVVPLLEPIPSPCRWYCENRYQAGISESLQIDTTNFTPEQIAQIVNLVRTFKP